MSENSFGTRKNPDASKRARRAGMRYARLKVAKEMADERKAYSDSLSILEKIAVLDRKLGPNKGAVKQRARLKAQLEAQALVEENKGRAPVVEATEAAKEVVPTKAPKKSSRQRLNEEAKAKREANNK